MAHDGVGCDRAVVHGGDVLHLGQFEIVEHGAHRDPPSAVAHVCHTSMPWRRASSRRIRSSWSARSSGPLPSGTRYGNGSAITAASARGVVPAVDAGSQAGPPAHPEWAAPIPCPGCGGWACGGSPCGDPAPDGDCPSAECGAPSSCAACSASCRGGEYGSGQCRGTALCGGGPDRAANRSG